MTSRIIAPALVFVAVLAAVPRGMAEDDDHRAGRPYEVSPFARFSDTGAYVGYMVGGGCALFHRAHGPSSDDGTWGWDYRGRCFARRIMHGWWNGRYQGGSGAYRTDGPHILPELSEEGGHSE
jgi:hypothetical protein